MNGCLRYCIGSDNHRVFTYSMENIGLPAFDTKRCICDDGIKTYAFGHWKTKQSYVNLYVKIYTEKLKFTFVIFLFLDSSGKVKGGCGYLLIAFRIVSSSWLRAGGGEGGGGATVTFS